MTRLRSRRGLLISAVISACLVALAVPVVAFGIVPLFVRSTANEVRPAAQALGQTPASPAVSISGDPSPSHAPAGPVVLAAGTLRKIDPVHYGSGQVLVLASGSSRYLRFEQVDIAAAPNMFVYLSDRKDGKPGGFTDLGPLRATNGSFNYELSSSLDLSTIHSVVVWCREFTVTVTYAELGGT